MIRSPGYQNTVEETGEPSERRRDCSAPILSLIMEEVEGLPIYFCNQGCIVLQDPLGDFFAQSHEEQYP